MINLQNQVIKKLEKEGFEVSLNEKGVRAKGSLKNIEMSVDA